MVESKHHDRGYGIAALLALMFLVLFSLQVSLQKKTTSETTKQRVSALEEQVQEMKAEK
jgi:hypothetical protein